MNKWGNVFSYSSLYVSYSDLLLDDELDGWNAILHLYKILDKLIPIFIIPKNLFVLHKYLAYNCWKIALLLYSHVPGLLSCGDWSKWNRSGCSGKKNCHYLVKNRWKIVLLFNSNKIKKLNFSILKMFLHIILKLFGI